MSTSIHGSPGTADVASFAADSGWPVVLKAIRGGYDGRGVWVCDTPADAGVCKELLVELGPTLPILGVCLGHQCLGEAFGGTVRRATQVMHGKVSRVTHSEQSVFRGIPSPFTATRYHSLVVDRENLPPDLEVTAWTDDGTVMGLRHRQYPLAGVQFHPEAILTEHGHAHGSGH